MRIENSFIPVRGVGEKTERKLWRNGVTHWDEFDPSFVGSKTGDRIESFIATASEQLDDGNSRFFASEFPSGESWRLYENFRPNTCFFDIETTGLSHHSSVVTTVSLHRDGETKTLVRGDDLTRDALRRELDGADLLVSFNGKRFDQPFLEYEFDLSFDTPHVDLMYPCKRLGLTGGLSAVESELEIGRGGMDISGEDAVRLWYRYEAGDEGALDTLVRYNQYDTRNLETILDHVCDTLHEDVFARHLP
ncbi:ribonuclease H-like domain-containing protein [Haladaptatus salinisoli]|uniref:ribonuclease H-like domain-containing protein n=1 Tax=Haladaptatus salinisoli TaxID=2884876 RepID=UPI001D09EDC0|nr:ribonuclease H-like domain-containing protein [Haladaptatus salinisoli]